jgi:hypothetical protein
MSELIAELLSFPTVIFTGLLGVVLLYWLSVMVGALDIDLFHAHGGLEGADGVVDGAIEGASAATEGAIHGAAHAAAGAADAADGALDGGDGHVHGAEGLLSALSLRRAPVTVTFSLIVFFGWIASYFGMHYLSGLGALGLPSFAIGLGVLVLAILVAIPLTSLATKPLEPVFKTQSAKRRSDYVGSVCVVRTGRVDDGFGQAEIVDGGTRLLITARIDTAPLRRGDKALIVDYDAEREAYILEAYDALMDDAPRPRARKTR